MSQFLAPVLREGDEEVEQSLRPRRLDEFVGFGEPTGVQKKSQIVRPVHRYAAPNVNAFLGVRNGRSFDAHADSCPVFTE